jgi:hypothetical protein
MSIKNSIEDFLIQTYQLKYNGDFTTHPLNVVQAIKSLIGINPEKPNQLLFDYIPKYLIEFQQQEIDDKEVIQVEYFASMINLEILLKEKKYKEAKNEILRLLQVSTGEPILELLILTSLQNQCQLPLINSIYRSVKFCNGRDVKYAIILMLHVMETKVLANENLKNIQLIHYSATIIEIENTQFVRNNEFENELKLLDYHQIYGKINKQNPSNLSEILIEKGREYLLTFIDENPSILNDVQNILILDSIRMILRHRPSNKFDNQLRFASDLIEKSIG